MRYTFQTDEGCEARNLLNAEQMSCALFEIREYVICLKNREGHTDASQKMADDICQHIVELTDGLVEE